MGFWLRKNAHFTSNFRSTKNKTIGYYNHMHGRKSGPAMAGPARPAGPPPTALLTSPNFARLQSAYRCSHSAETALLHVMNGIYVAADTKKATTPVTLDISAAFDTIDHDVLLSHFGCEFSVSWLCSYLSDRQQYVKLGKHSSTVTQCRYGIPQRSVLEVKK